MKRICRLLAVLFLATGLILPARGAFAASRDEKIAYLQKAGVVTGYPDGTLGLDAPIKRSEIATLLVKIDGKQAEAAEKAAIFKDVPTSHWANGFIRVASQMKNPGGVSAIIGYPDGTFRPEKNISNAEMMKILVAGAKADLTLADEAKADWPASWINWAREMNIVGPGAGVGELDPDKSATRGDVFVMVYNAKVKEQGPAEMPKANEEKPKANEGEEKPLKDQDPLNAANRGNAFHMIFNGTWAKNLPFLSPNK